MIHFGMDPQVALDAPRFCIGPGHAGSSGSVALEEGVAGEVAKKLRAMGHPIEAGVSGNSRKGHVTVVEFLLQETHMIFSLVR